jgi:hypothetical protein
LWKGEDKEKCTHVVRRAFVPGGILHTLTAVISILRGGRTFCTQKVEINLCPTALMLCLRGFCPHRRTKIIFGTHSDHQLT